MEREGRRHGAGDRPRCVHPIALATSDRAALKTILTLWPEMRQDAHLAGPDAVSAERHGVYRRLCVDLFPVGARAEAVDRSVLRVRGPEQHQGSACPNHVRRVAADLGLRAQGLNPRPARAARGRARAGLGGRSPQPGAPLTREAEPHPGARLARVGTPSAISAGGRPGPGSCRPRCPARPRTPRSA